MRARERGGEGWRMGAGCCSWPLVVVAERDKRKRRRRERERGGGGDGKLRRVDKLNVLRMERD